MTQQRVVELWKQIEDTLDTLSDAYEELDKAQITPNNVDVYLKYPQEKES